MYLVLFQGGKASLNFLILFLLVVGAHRTLCCCQISKHNWGRGEPDQKDTLLNPSSPSPPSFSLSSLSSLSSLLPLLSLPLSPPLSSLSSPPPLSSLLPLLLLSPPSLSSPLS